MLRNAFDLIATEGTLRNILRAVTFARTPADQLRVNVDNQASVQIWAGNTNSAMQGAVNQPGLWVQGAWNAIDARYEFGETLNMNFIQNTRNRWTIT